MIIWLLVGMCIGACAGYVVAAILLMGKDGEKENEA